MRLSFTSLFSGAGGLDLGFEMAGFKHAFSTDIDTWSVKTICNNRPDWHVKEADVRDLAVRDLPDSDVMLAGFPCQGFSLGGNRLAHDERNFLFREVIRLAKGKRPRFVIIENVLNLRTMKDPSTGLSFIEIISESFRDIGYHVKHNIFRLSNFGVPQTRRRFIFVASLDEFPDSFHWPLPESETPASLYLGDIAENPSLKLHNHEPYWNFNSRVHKATGEAFDPHEMPVPCRFSRTGSDGHPVRSLDFPFPAVDTATIWGWAQGHVIAERKEKDRIHGLFVRNQNTDLKLWRISASRLRCFTDREYARLQTFPDDWFFRGANKRHIHKQIGNAVPVQFSYRIARFIQNIYEAQNAGKAMGLSVSDSGLQLELKL
ncbi:MAG: DNA cytosine methyltransferase [Cyanobacteria bacterium]|nr:DNA cytosine methyltransferase [Cyanobacteriota bacterium]